MSEPGGDPTLYDRQRMVERQLRRKGIRDERVLKAMEEVPRHRFVEESYRSQAYEDHPLPIGDGQTISQPYMVALMTELCAPSSSDRALEIGAGSGYQTAILSRLCREVFASEIIEALVIRARAVLKELGLDNIILERRDGSGGWPEVAPFDVILVAAGAPEVPAPLLDQLAEGGRLVIPVGGREVQILRRVTRGRGGGLLHEDDTPCRFVDLRGRYGWDRGQFS
jgi:protein-L-isoaspartate(D-aspartate) O-methyltransferase